MGKFGLLVRETGEILESGFRVITDEQLKIIKKQYDIKRQTSLLEDWNKDLGGFIMVLYKVCEEFNRHKDVLSQSDITRLVMTATYMNYDGKLTYENGKNIDRTGLKKILNISDRAFGDFYGKVTDTKILIENNEGIFVNKEYFYKNNIKSIKHILNAGYTFTRLYIGTVRSIYNSCTSRQHKQLALIFRIIPYINYEWNVVCFNPTEKDENKIKFMNLQDLTNTLGYSDEKALKRELRNIKIGEECVVGFFQMSSDSRENKIIINPKAMYQGSNYERLQALSMQFIPKGK